MSAGDDERDLALGDDRSQNILERSSFDQKLMPDIGQGFFVLESLQFLLRFVDYDLAIPGVGF